MARTPSSEYKSAYMMVNGSVSGYLLQVGKAAIGESDMHLSEQRRCTPVSEGITSEFVVW